MAAAIFTTGKAFHLCAADVVIADQQDNQCELGVHPALTEITAGVEADQPAAEDQRCNHCRGHDATVQLALHDDETLAADRVLTHRVIDEQSWQIEQGCKPADH